MTKDSRCVEFHLRSLVFSLRSLVLNMDWNIQQPSKICTNCRSIFSDKDAFHSFLKLQGEEVHRQDYCEICYGGVKDTVRSGGDQAYWKGKFRVILPAVKEDPIKKDKVEYLLRRYLAGDVQEHKKICYLLTVMLERKRVLKSLKTIVDDKSGNKILVYEHTKTGESFLIPDPCLAINEIPELQKQVQELLASVEKPAI